MSEHQQPLSGIRVVDLTQIYQGPYAALLMAFSGAEVVKVEPPGGERLRGAGGAKTPMSFAMLNSNKKSLTLNLKCESGIAVLKQLVAQADVLLENFAPGVMDRLGVGWPVLQDLNPRLIYATATGYGLSGPDRDLLAMDHTIQAASGVMSVTGDADRPPGRAGGAPCDIMGGIHMYAGVMTALLGRSSSGRGTRVEVSMLESMYYTLCSEFTALHAAGGVLPERNSARSPAAAAPYGRYRCSDGWIAIICVAEIHWQSIVRVIGRADLANDESLARAPLRKAREAQVNALIEAWSGQLTRDQAYAQMREARVPVAPVRTIDEVRVDPHLHQRGMLEWIAHPQLGDIVLPANPIRYADYAAPQLSYYPEAGQHTDEVLGDWLGMDAQSIATLRRETAI
ncbi:MAG: CoA transferase [Proteobacteria bacterium]|nr:CoA transferase [Pseudomonadota bacterium]